MTLIDKYSIPFIKIPKNSIKETSSARSYFSEQINLLLRKIINIFSEMEVQRGFFRTRAMTWIGSWGNLDGERG